RIRPYLPELLVPYHDGGGCRLRDAGHRRGGVAGRVRVLMKRQVDAWSRLGRWLGSCFGGAVDRLYPARFDHLAHLLGRGQLAERAVVVEPHGLDHPEELFELDAHEAARARLPELHDVATRAGI